MIFFAVRFLNELSEVKRRIKVNRGLIKIYYLKILIF